jgi:tetratricopeptide (TPR) repeat protein
MEKLSLCNQKGWSVASSCFQFNILAMSLRALVLLVSLLHTAPAMADLFPDNEKGRALLNQALALEAEGKGNEAFDRYREAALADPKASTPVAHIAYMLYISSKAAPAKEAPGQREQAAAAANAALQLDARDPLAMEVLRALSDSVQQPRHQPSSAATKAVNEGELLFNEKKFDAAAAKYEQAIALDPAYAEAVLLLGDCYFMQGDMVRAEQTFRKATTIDPLYGSAWRFLFDAQMHLGKLKDAEASAISAIAAAPSERQSWLRMGQPAHALQAGARRQAGQQEQPDARPRRGRGR